MSILLHTCCSCTFMFFHDVLAVFYWKRGQTLAPSQLLFLPCTWLSPEAEICHLWSLARWMRLAHSLKVTAHKQPLCIWAEGVSHSSHRLYIMNGHGRYFCQTRWEIFHSDTYFLSALLESHALSLTTETQHFQLPSQNCGLQRSSVRPHFVQRRETSANMDNNHV